MRLLRDLRRLAKHPNDKKTLDRVRLFIVKRDTEAVRFDWDKDKVIVYDLWLGNAKPVCDYTAKELIIYLCECCECGETLSLNQDIIEHNESLCHRSCWEAAQNGTPQ